VNIPKSGTLRTEGDRYEGIVVWEIRISPLSDTQSWLFGL
jgi:hypothetical protein